MSFLHWLLGSVITGVCGLALAQALPPPVASALARAKVPREAVTLLVVDAQGRSPARLSHRAQVPVQPASVMKLVTTYAALELLGPAYSWRTPVLLEGVVREGTLYGNLYLQGRGDPKLVAERLWLLLRQVQGLGIQHITGDIVLDNSAFEVAGADPARFDGEPLRPYNTAPDALLINFKSVVMTFMPDRAANTARVQFEPPLAGVQMQTQVPLSDGACDDYRATLQADFSDPARLRFAGSYPASCAQKVWPVAYADPGSYNMRAVAGLWREMGGQLGGRVRAGHAAPSVEGSRDSSLTPVFELRSPPLAEVIRDINKHSNNVMAQQLFLTLSLPLADPAGQAGSGAAAQPASHEASRAIVRRWWQARIGADDAPTLDNGSGLSRQERITALALARLLQTAYRSPWMPELMASLPIAGVDGTLRRSPALRQGSAHLKTGRLRDVAAVAGYVQGASGRHYVLVAIANHAAAHAVQPAFEALLDWTAQDD